MDAKKLAEAIARNLFTNGFGHRAERLVMMVDGPPKLDLGGWSEHAVANLILQHLQGEGR